MVPEGENIHGSKVKFRKILHEDYPAIRKILEQVEWHEFPFITDPDLFKKLLDNTDRSVVALEDSRIVGVASALCNDVSIGYVTMFAVSPDKQGCGIGGRLVTILLGNDPNIKWVLSSAKESVGFWEKHGFVFNAMMVKPRVFDLSRRFGKHHDIKTKKTLKNFIRNQIRRIFR
jgi:N-acetylglutamate synthase-like GNAT family acetyltransferase